MLQLKALIMMIHHQYHCSAPYLTAIYHYLLLGAASKEQSLIRLQKTSISSFSKNTQLPKQV